MLQQRDIDGVFDAGTPCAIDNGPESPRLPLVAW
jgi:hypothetical protein